MSLINEYRATEEAIKELQERLKNLSQDDKLQKELEFEGKLRALMGEYSKSLRDIIVQGTARQQGDRHRQARAQGKAVQEPEHR